jgi:hypothetical protein
VLVTLLDGTRDRETLVSDLAARMAGVAPADLAVWLEASLTELARSALLLPG